MTISVLSSQTLTASGNIVIPANTSLVIALVKGSILPPKIGAVTLTTIASIDATGKSKAVSIHQLPAPTEGALASVINGESVTFVYLSGASVPRAGSIFGHSDAGSYTADLVTSTSDLVLGILTGMIGPTALKGDTVAFTYLVNTTIDKIGHITPADALLTSIATDDDVSTGYYIDGGVIHHDAVKISDAYSTFDPVLHTVTYQYDHHEGTNPIVHYFREYDNGVYTKLVASKSDVMYSWNYYAYPEVKHPEVWQPAFDENLPDIWVPGGEHAQVSACFVSIKSTAPDSVFVGRPMMF